MKRKTLYALTMLLLLSSMAFPNERSRFHCWTSGNCAAASKEAVASPRDARASKTVSTEEPSGTSGNHLLLHTFIKLLYI